MTESNCLLPQRISGPASATITPIRHINIVLKSTNYTSLPFKASVLLLSGSWSVPEIYWHSDLSALPAAMLIALSLSYSFAKGDWSNIGDSNSYFLLGRQTCWPLNTNTAYMVSVEGLEPSAY